MSCIGSSATALGAGLALEIARREILLSGRKKLFMKNLRRVNELFFAH